MARKGADPPCGLAPKGRDVMRVTFAFKVPQWCRQDVTEEGTGDIGLRIDRMCDEILRLWNQDLAHAEKQDGAAMANDNLRERVYLLGFWLRSIDCLDIARDHVRRSGRKGRRPKSDEAATFIDFLHHIFREVAEGSAANLSSKSRPRIARELAYALRHNIPPVLVVSFLRCRPQAEILRRQKLGIVEEWLVEPAA